MIKATDIFISGKLPSAKRVKPTSKRYLALLAAIKKAHEDEAKFNKVDYKQLEQRVTI